LSALSANQRLKTSLGGFVSFTGFIILVVVILTGTGAVDMKSVFQNEVMMGSVAAMGFLDILCGLFVVFRDKKIKLSFTTHKKKTENNIE
jgi:uncharacterized membrane protein